MTPQLKQWPEREGPFNNEDTMRMNDEREAKVRITPVELKPVLVAGATGYPAELACDVLTGRGALLLLRPIRPSDANLLVRFHEGLSSDSIFRRYFSLHPHLSDAEVRHLTSVDYVDRLAFVVLGEDALVGIGRYDRLPGTTDAEVAFIVADPYQRQGIGLLLLWHLADAAWARGITSFVADTQAENRPMMHVFTRSGFATTSILEDDVFTVRFPIEPTAASDAATRHHGERARRSVASDGGT